MNIKFSDGFDKAVRLAQVLTVWPDKLRLLDFLAPLALRLYLVPIFWMAGSKKFANFTSTAEWFGNNEFGLGLPLPYLLVFLVAAIEVLGALFFIGSGNYVSADYWLKRQFLTAEAAANAD